MAVRYNDNKEIVEKIKEAIWQDRLLDYKEEFFEKYKI